MIPGLKGLTAQTLSDRSQTTCCRHRNLPLDVYYYLLLNSMPTTLKFIENSGDPFIDTQLLQADINNLNEWACKWQLRFNADKCESMRITHLRDKSVSKYFFEKPLKKM